jgi:hypothetical protein
MYNKRSLSKDTKASKAPKSISKPKDIILDPMGQWKHPGQNTRIPGNDITMQGVNYPVLGIGSNGQEQMMYPGQDYKFQGADYVDEYPQMKKGGGLKSKKYSRDLEATNYLFHESPLFKKPKSKKKKIYHPKAKHYQKGGQTDEWGRPTDSPWYGFNPDTNKFTTSDPWGRKPGNEWYGFNQNTHTWEKGKKASEQKENEEVQRKRYESLYEPIEEKVLGALGTDEDFYTLPAGTYNTIQQIYGDFGLKRNIPPVDPVLKEMQNKLLSLPEADIQKLLNTKWTGMAGLANLATELPENVSYKELYKYYNHINKLKKQGYTLQEGGTPEDYDQFLSYSQTAPENRRPNEGYVYGDPNDYDHYGMWDALGKPETFEQALEMNPDWQPDEYDGSYHGFSVNPNTGIFLKSGKPGMKPGDTTWMEVKDHYLSNRSNSSNLTFNPDLQRFQYTPNENYIETELTPEEIQQYRDGGYIVEELPQAKKGRISKRKKKESTEKPSEPVQVYNSKEEAFPLPMGSSVNTEPTIKLDPNAVIDSFPTPTIKPYVYPAGDYADQAWAVQQQIFPQSINTVNDWYKNWYAGRMENPKFTNVATERYLAALNRSTPFILEADPEFSENHNALLAVTYKPKVLDPANESKKNQIFINNAIEPDAGFNDYYNEKFIDPEYSGNYFIREGIHEKSHWDENNFRQPGTDPYWVDKDVVLKDILPKSKYNKNATMYNENRTDENPHFFNTDFKGGLDEDSIDYLSLPTEIRARLNVWRQLNNIDPTKNYSVEELQKIMDQNIEDGYERNEGDYRNIIELYHILQGDPEVLKTLNDEFVQNDNSAGDQLNMAKKGGSLLTKKVTCKKCGWKWDAADGGDDITTCHKCGGQGLVHAKTGGTKSESKPELGKQVYTYEDRPEAKYKKDSKGTWHIMLPSTNGKYVPIKDPDKKRTGELNEKAKPVKPPQWQQDKKKYGKDKVEWYESFNPNDWFLNDYSKYSSYNSAFRTARESGEDEFLYKGERYNTKLVDKKHSDRYWDSKNFVEEYYKDQPLLPDDLLDLKDAYIQKKHGTNWSDYYNNVVMNDPINKDYNKWNKARYEEMQDSLDMLDPNNLPTDDPDFLKFANKNKYKKELSSLKKPTYFSITDYKPSDMSEDGYWSAMKNKMFMSTKADPGQLNTTFVHELSHKADGYDVYDKVPDHDIKKWQKSVWADGWDQEKYNYVSNPSEVEARKLSTLYWFKEHGWPYKPGKIRQEALDRLYDAKLDDKIPYDMDQLLDLYGTQNDDLLRYLNSDYTENRELGGTIGDELDLTPEEEAQLRKLGYTLERL